MNRVAILYFLFSTGCGEILAPFAVPEGAVEFTPAVMVANSHEWSWRVMERCSGKTGDYARVRWFYYPGPLTFRALGKTVWGLWLPSHRIYLSEPVKDEPFNARHEMLHDLLHTGAHPPEYFEERCGAELGLGVTSRFPDPIPQNVPYP